MKTEILTYKLVKSTVSYGTEHENIGVRTFVKTVGNIKRFVNYRIKVNIPPLTNLAKLIVNELL